MKLTDLQLECMKLWADKTLSFGCIVIRWENIEWTIVTNSWWWHFSIKFDDTTSSVRRNSSMDKIIWHPITRWRLCYLQATQKYNYKTRLTLDKNFFVNPALYNQTILEWNEETLLLILQFLKSIY